MQASRLCSPGCLTEVKRSPFSAIAEISNRRSLQPASSPPSGPTLPPVDAEKYLLPPLAGSFVSDDLPVSYDLQLMGDDLKAVIRGRSGEVRSTEVFRHVSDRTFSSGSTVLKFDPDQRGFIVTNGPSSIRLYRSPR